MQNNEIIILGSGRSINDLSENEINYINSAEITFALNKFMIFFDIAKIIPTHVYFVDSYWKPHIQLQYIFNTCFTHKLENITFVLNDNLKGCLRLIESDRNIQMRNLGWIRLTMLAISRRLPENYRVNTFNAPSSCNYQFVKRSSVGDKWIWANNLNDKLFHYRSSLTDLLNYISIAYPNKRIKLIGVDLNSHETFFQDSLDRLPFNPNDWTSAISAKAQQHFTVIDYGGKNMLNELPYIIECLKKSGNQIYACNQKSLLVKKGYVSFIPIME